MQDSLKEESAEAVTPLASAKAVASFRYCTESPGWVGNMDVHIAMDGESSRLQMIGSDAKGGRYEFVNLPLPSEVASRLVLREWLPLSDQTVEALRKQLCSVDENWPQDAEDGVEVTGVESSEGEAAVYVWGGSPCYLSVSVLTEGVWREMTADDDGRAIYKDQVGVAG